MTFNKLSAAWWRFAFLLALLLSALLISTEAQHRGDAVEYSLVTVALATHGTPDVRPSDITLARSLAPALQGVYDLVEPGLRQNGKDLYPAFAIGKDGKGTRSASWAVLPQRRLNRRSGYWHFPSSSFCPWRC